MSDIIYRIRSSENLSHAYTSQYKNSTYDPSKRSNRYERKTPLLNKAKAAKKAGNPYGNYKSPYYDPVARHERYMKERKSLGVGVEKPSLPGSGTSGRGGGGGKSGGSGRGGGKSGGSGRGGGKSSSASSKLAAEIQKLREENSLNTEAQREAARRKIEDIQSQLQERIKKLRESSISKANSTQNAAERRGIVQNLRKQIEDLQNKSSEEAQKESKRLSDWITKESDSLEYKIRDMYKAKGMSYTPRTQASKENASKARNKEVQRRADSIYKSKSKK